MMSQTIELVVKLLIIEARDLVPCQDWRTWAEGCLLSQRQMACPAVWLAYGQFSLAGPPRSPQTCFYKNWPEVLSL